MNKNLTPKQVKEEFEKCQNSKAYFYNNYCRKEGMPEYSEEEFDKYINTVKVMRSGQRLGDHRMKAYLKKYPMTANDVFHVYIAGIDPYDDNNKQ